MENDEPEFFDLDKHKLDVELERQPRLYYEHAAKLADARRDYEQAEAEKDLVEAEVDRAIRSDPAEFGFDGNSKPTETAIKNAVATSKRVKATIHAAIQAKHAVDILQAGVTALDHRKRALEKLVDLRLAEYFADPILPKGEREKIENSTKRAARTAGQKRQRGDDDD